MTYLVVTPHGDAYRAAVLELVDAARAAAGELAVLEDRAAALVDIARARDRDARATVIAAAVLELVDAARAAAGELAVLEDRAADDDLVDIARARDRDARATVVLALRGVLE